MTNVRTVLDAAAIQAWADGAVAAFDRRRGELNALNVFPVADADTGTNLAVTMRAGRDALAEAITDRSARDAASSLRALARGAALAARGNSGVIMAELLRGLAEGAETTEAGEPGENRAIDCDGAVWRRALERAASTAYAAVASPAEGTILSVARAAADSVRDLPAAATLADVVVCARAHAIAALLRTPAQLSVLAEAGVVDAGGRGLVVLLDQLGAVVTDEPSVLDEPPAADSDRPALDRPPLERQREAGSTAFAYEVQYLLDAPPEELPRLRATLLAVGDSVTIAAPDSEVWNVHVHVNDVGAAIEAGVAAGRPHRIQVTRFADSDPGAPGSGAGGEIVAAPTGLIVLLANAGLARLFDDAGAQVAVLTADTDLDETVRRAAGSARCILLPTGDEVAGAAATIAAAARAAGVVVAVVPCRSPMQALAAVAVHDDRRRAEDDVIAMAEAAAATRFARVEIAAGPGLTTIGACAAGDVLGLIDGDVVEIGSSRVGVVVEVLIRLLGIGGELVTAVIGTADLGDLEAPIRECIAKRAPLVELSVYADDALDCIALLGME